MSRHTAEEIIQAYQRTGSVWRAGKELGIAGQTVHDKLKALQYPLANSRWSEEEEAELRILVDNMTISEVATQLGRPYYGVAMKISRLGIGVRYGNNQRRKTPRGAGYDKVSLLKYIRMIDQSHLTLSRFARSNGLSVGTLTDALVKHYPEWLEKYRGQHSDAFDIPCQYCQRPFTPTNGKHVYCSTKCSSTARTDDSYFGGKRKTTIGLAEGICQLCLENKTKGLSSHHIYGKENDPENDFLIALCLGCHQIVTILGGRKFLNETEGWERLVQLVYMRHHGAERPPVVYSCVEVEVEHGDEACE